MKRFLFCILVVALVLVGPALALEAQPAPAAAAAHDLVEILPDLHAPAVAAPALAENAAPRGPPAALVRATRTWSAAADGNWSNPANWDGGASVPSTTDAIVFSNASVKNCTLDNLGTWSGGTFTIQSTYSGTITQNSGINITTAAFSQAAGTFSGNSGATFTSTTFSVTGGEFDQGGSFTSTTFGITSTGGFGGSNGGAAMSTTAVTFSNTGNIKATSGLWTLSGSWTQSGSTTTFTHNSGQITIAAASTFNDARSSFNLIGIATTNAAVTISASTTVPLQLNPTTTVGTSTLTIAGTVTFGGQWVHTGSITTNSGSTITGTSTPTISLNLNLTITNVTTITNPIGTVTFTSGGASTLTDTSDLLSGTTYVVTKTGSGTFTVAASTTCRLGASPTMASASGSFTVNGTVSWSGLWTITTTGNITTGAASVLTGTGSPTISSSASLTINATTTLTNPVSAITLTGSSGTLTVTDTGDKFSAATYTINFGGASSQAFTVAASTNCRIGATPTLTMGSGAVTVTGTLTWSGTLTVSTTGGFTATGTLTGTATPGMSIKGNLTTSAATITNPILTVSFIGTTSTTYTDTGDKLSNTTFTLGDGSNKNVTIAASTNCRTGAVPAINLGTGTLTVTGTWTFSGAATITGVLTATGTITGTGTPTIAISRSLTTSGATITNPIGTVTFTGAQATTTYTDTTAALTAATFIVNVGSNNFTVAASTTCALGSNPTTTTGTGAAGFTVTGTTTFAGAWTHNGGLTVTGTLTGTSTPTISLAGNLTTSAATITNPIGTVTFTGATAVTYTDTGDKLSGTTFVLNKTNNFTIAASTNCRVGTNPTTHVDAAAGNNCLTVQGTLIVGGTTWTNTGNIQVSATGTITAASLTTINTDRGIVVTAGGTFPSGIVVHWTDSAVSGTGVTFTAAGINFGTCTVNQPNLASTWTVSASTTLPLGNNPTFTMNTGVNLSVSGTVSGTGALTCTGNILVNSGGSVSGFSSLSLPGNLNVNAAGTFPTIPVSFTASGSASSTLTGTATAFGTISVDKGAFPSPIFAVAANTICPLGANPSTRATWTSVSGTVTWTGTWTNEDDINVANTGTISGGTDIQINNGAIGINAAATIPAGLNIVFNYPGPANGTNFLFAGGGKSYGAIRRTGVGTSGITIGGSNTFASLRDNDASSAHFWKFTAGTTQTIAASPSQYMIDGGVSNTVTLQSTAGGSAFTLHCTGAKPVNLRNCTISDCTVDTTPEWWAGPACTNGSGNTNIHFAKNPRLRAGGSRLVKLVLEDKQAAPRIRRAA